MHAARLSCFTGAAPFCDETRAGRDGRRATKGERNPPLYTPGKCQVPSAECRVPSAECRVLSASALANPPPVHRTRVEERGRRHHAVLLEHLPVLHHELDMLQRLEILERITGHGDDVGKQTRLERTASLFRLAHLVSVDRHRAKDIRIGNARVLPSLEELQTELAACLALD